uniref:ORF19 n=1 Tax=Fowl aviadenovirus D TaxID=190064 RepID=A0A7D4VD83_9ADEN|nr:ORF19 [Fowl aviadenovirus D]
MNLSVLVGVLFGASVISGANSAVARLDSGNRSCVARPDSLKLDAPRGVGRPSRTPSRITWYGSHGGVPRFHDASYQYGIYHRLHSALAGKTDIIVLVPGYYMGYQSFRKVLRFHQKMTPAVALLLVDWELYYDYDGLYVDFGKFLRDIPKSKRLHCIGHSAGAHACSTICRQWTYISRDRRCTRIVGLEPTSVKGGLEKDDAEYVAVLKTEGSWITGGYTASEDIMLDDRGGRSCGIHGGWSGRVCAESIWGQTVCEEFSWRDTWSKSGCFHRLIVPKFLKTLDVRTGLPMFHLLNEGYKVGPVRSTWNGYTMSRDYRYSSFFNHISIKYMTEITYLPVTKEDFVTPIMIIVVASSGSQMFIGGYSEQTLRYGRYDVLTAVGYTELAEEVLWIRHWNPAAHIYLVYVITPQGYYQDSLSTPSVGDRKVMTGGCVRTMHCNPTRDPFGRPAHYCMVTKERFPLMSYRAMLNPNGGSYVSVPPQSGCLADRNNSMAMIPIQLSDVEVKVGHKLRVDLSNKSPFWLTSIQLTDSTGTHKLYSFWDVCQMTTQCVFQLDRMKKEFNVTFFAVDTFELEFNLEFEVIKLKVTVLPLEPVVKKVSGLDLTNITTDSPLDSTFSNLSLPTQTSMASWTETSHLPEENVTLEESVLTVTLNGSESSPRWERLQDPVQSSSEKDSKNVATEAVFLLAVGFAFVAMLVVLLRTRRRKTAVGPPLLNSGESFTP